MLVDERYCVALEGGADDAHTAPLLCAGLIGYRSLRLAGDAETVGLYGFGAAAHIIAQVAIQQGRRVYAFVRPGAAAAQRFAESLGVHWAGASDQQPPVPLDAAILFAPVGALVPAALAVVRPGGSTAAPLQSVRLETGLRATCTSASCRLAPLGRSAAGARRACQWVNAALEAKGSDMTQSKPTLQTIKKALDDIGAAGDAARLQVHFLSLRARERTGELAANIEALEHRLDQGLGEAMDRAASKTRQLSSAVRDLLGQTRAREGELSVQSIMTDAVAACAPDDALNAAARQMWEHDCGAVPVLADGKLVGIITDRDICMAAYTQGRALTAITIKDVMARHVHVCRPDDTLERAASLMADASVRRLPVVDSDERLLGMVSMADIARGAPALGQREAAELVFQLTRAISRRTPEAQPEPRAAE